MRAFSVSSEYIFDSTASLNLILATAMSSSAPTSASTSAPASAPASNAAPLPPTDTPTTNEDYNASQVVISFLVIVKPTSTKYLEETRNVSIKRVT